MNSKITSRSSIILSTLLTFICIAQGLISIGAQLLPHFSSNDNNYHNSINLQSSPGPAAIDYYIQLGGAIGPSGWKAPLTSEGGDVGENLQQELLGIDNSIRPTYYDVPLSTKLEDLSRFNYLTTKPLTSSSFETVNNAITRASLLEYLKHLKDENIKPNVAIEDSTFNVIQPRAIAHGHDEGEEDNLLSTGANEISDPINIPIEDLALQPEIDLNIDLNHHDNNKSIPLDALFAVYVNKVLERLQNQNSIKQLPEASIRKSIDNNFASAGDDLIVDDNQPGTDLANDDSEEDKQRSTTRYGNGEYIDHPLALIGHQYVQGGAGEGRQLLGPEGTFENVQVIKSDRAVPSYCDPPNPCPIGYKAEDGCLERFVNSASFSREYQAKQRCSCDNEHSLFNCAAPSLKNQNNNDITFMNTLIGGGGGSDDSKASNQSPSLVNHRLTTADNNNNGIKEHEEDDDDDDENHMNKLNTLARTIQNRFGSLPSLRNLINDNLLSNKQQAQESYETDNSDRVHKRA